jgi:hypothetical protein
VEFKSRGHLHHHDSKQTCPQCGRTFLTHCVVAQDPDGHLAVAFKSKQTEQWGATRIPLDRVAWAGTNRAAWDAQKALEGR